MQHKPTKEVFALKEMKKSAFPKKNDLARLLSERRCLVELGKQKGGRRIVFFGGTMLSFLLGSF